MQPNKAAFDRILGMDDAHLRQLIAQLAAGAGIAPNSLNVSDADLAALRQTLSSSSPEAIMKQITQITTKGKGISHG
ncbi:MAG: hypothetical protein IJC15_03560 [Clostridia bacterium]|nr:hypothetical protein [Clostridia bacterium]